MKECGIIVRKRFSYKNRSPAKLPQPFVQIHPHLRYLVFSYDQFKLLLLQAIFILYELVHY